MTGGPQDAEAANLTDGWSLLGTEPDAVAGPNDLPSDGWRDAVVPGTVAVAVGPEDPWSHQDYDARDWWYRLRFPSPSDDGGRHILAFEGLATLATVWLNGEPILQSDNMFRRHRMDVTDRLGEENELAIVFRSLGARLARRYPRPRWKTALVDEQDLRWHRATLMGRMPGWTPPISAVGPWRAVRLSRAAAVRADDLLVRTFVDADLRRFVTVRGVVHAERGTVAALTLRVGDDLHELPSAATHDGLEVDTRIEVGEVPLWYPHTQGTPALVPLALVAETDGASHELELGARGFRRVDVDRTEGRVSYSINGSPVFCRGACWTPGDMRALDSTPEGLRVALQSLADANGNMIRVGGTMTYESDVFYELCDELGIMVWQDFMFANMDYPMDDDGFRAEVAEEAAQEIRRIGAHPSVVTWCGGSEVEQQAAMFGAPREIWSNEFFATLLPDLVERLHPGTPYWPSTPTGGALPFHVGEGLTHYYGVGAYLRPLDDVRLAGVRFTPETLGFSNVPDPEVVNAMTLRGPVPPHHPAWKRGVPRDAGAGWDFEDVRDHYLESLHGVDAMQLRYEDLERYWSLSRTVTGYLMDRVFREWRAEEAGCGGGLVWFLRDLVPGAGWGVLDHRGAPKAAYWYLRRAWSERIVSLLDRGLDGVVASVVNESVEPLEGRLVVRVVDGGSTVTAEGEREVRVAPGGKGAFSVDDMIGHFMDLTYSYRFGPRKHEAVLVELIDAEGRRVADDCLVVDRTRSAAAEVTATVEPVDEQGRDLRLVLESDSLVHDVCIELRHHAPSDNYVTLHPGRRREIELRWRGTEGSFRGSLSASNLALPVRLSLPS